jgi:hypothetical protein
MTCTALWPVPLYDMYRFMTCTALWHVPLYDLYRFMTCTALWHVPLYDLYRLMTCTALWPVPLYDLYRFMTRTALWRVPPYDMYRFMTCTALWHVPLYDLYRFMTCTALWSVPLYGLYRLPTIIRVIKSRRVRSAGHVARMGHRRGVERISVRGHEGRKQLGRPRRRWKDNIKMNILCSLWGTNWISFYSYLLTYLLHGAQSFLISQPVCS